MTQSRTVTLATTTAAMWLVWVVDLLTPGAIGHGIIPRTSEGLFGIVMAPFLHGNLQHLVANTIPFVVLGAIILLRGTQAFIFVVLVTAAVAGAGTWLFGTPNTNHIGASGVVFGFLGYVLLRALYDRRISSLLIAVVVGSLYGTMLISSILPAAGISWTGHVFGFAGGVTAAKLRYGARAEAG